MRRRNLSFDDSEGSSSAILPHGKARGSPLVNGAISTKGEGATAGAATGGGGDVSQLSAISADKIQSGMMGDLEKTIDEIDVTIVKDPSMAPPPTVPSMTPPTPTGLSANGAVTSPAPGVRLTRDDSCEMSSSSSPVMCRSSAALLDALQIRSGRTELRQVLLQMEREASGLREANAKHQTSISTLQDALFQAKQQSAAQAQRFVEEKDHEEQERQEQIGQLVEQLRMVRRSAESLLAEKTAISEEALRQKKNLLLLIERERAEKQEIMQDYRKETETIIVSQGREITHLRGLVERLQHEKDLATVRDEQKASELTQLSQQILVLEREKTAWEQQRAELEGVAQQRREQEALAYQRQVSGKEVERLQQKNQELQREMNELRDAMSKAQCTAETQEAELRSAHAADERGLRDQISKLLAEKEAGIYSVTRQQSEAVSRMEELLRESERRLEATKEQLITEREARGREHQQTRDQLIQDSQEAVSREVEAAVQPLQHRIEQLIEEKRVLAAQHHSAATELEARYQDSQSASQCVSAALEESQTLLKHVTAERDESRAAVISLRDTLAHQHGAQSLAWESEREGLEESVRHLEEQQRETLLELETVREGIREKEMVYSTLRGQEVAASERLMEVQRSLLHQEALAQRSQLEGAALLELTREQEHLKLYLSQAKLQFLRQRLVSEGEERDKLTREVHHLTQTVQKLRAEQAAIIETHEQEIVTIREQGEDEIREMEKVLMELRLDLSKSQTMASQYLKELTAVHKEREGVRSQLEMEVEELRKRFAALRRELEFKEMLVEELQGNMRVAHTQLGNSEAENVTLHEEVVELSKKLQDTHTLLGRKDGSINQLRARLRALESRGPSLSSTSILVSEEVRHHTTTAPGPMVHTQETAAPLPKNDGRHTPTGTAHSIL